MASFIGTIPDPEGGSTSYAYDTLNRLQTLTPPTAFAVTLRESGDFCGGVGLRIERWQQHFLSRMAGSLLFLAGQVKQFTFAVAAK